METDRVQLPIAADATAREGAVGARRLAAAPTGSQTLAWQRELAQAQTGGFSGWFSPVDPPLRQPDGVPLRQASAATAAAGTNGARVPRTDQDVVASSRPPLTRAGLGGSEGADTASFVQRTGSMAYGVTPLAAAVALPAAGYEGTQPPVVAWPASSVGAAPSAHDDASPTSPLPVWLSMALQAPVASVSSSSGTLCGSLRLATADDGAEVEREPIRSPLSSPDASRGTSASAEPMRVYAEWNEDSVRVWLGADSDRLDAISRIARVLRDQLKQQGVRLSSLVCNGTDISLHDTAAAAVSIGSPSSIDSPRSEQEEL